MRSQCNVCRIHMTSTRKNKPPLQPESLLTPTPVIDCNLMLVHTAISHLVVLLSSQLAARRPGAEPTRHLEPGKSYRRPAGPHIAYQQHERKPHPSTFSINMPSRQCFSQPVLCSSARLSAAPWHKRRRQTHYIESSRSTRRHRSRRRN